MARVTRRTRGRVTTRVEGKRYSRVVLIIGDGDVCNSKIGLTFGERIVTFTFGERVAEIKEACAALLRKSGLPAVLRVYYGADPKAWQTTMPAARPRTMSSLDRYVRKRGYKRDSAEDLAARIITAAHRMESNPAHAQEFAFELGRLTTLADIYAVDSAASSRRGKAGAEVRWRGENADRRVADNIIRRLAVQEDEPPADLWDQFFGDLDAEQLGPALTENPDETFIEYGDGNRHRITFKTFRNKLSQYRQARRHARVPGAVPIAKP